MDESGATETMPSSNDRCGNGGGHDSSYWCGPIRLAGNGKAGVINIDALRAPTRAFDHAT